MITSTQRESLSVLAEVLELSPDVRLGQLLAHLGFLGEDQTGRSLGNIDDEQLLGVLYHHRGELVARLAAEPAEGESSNRVAAPVVTNPSVTHSSPSIDLECS